MNNISRTKQLAIVTAFGRMAVLLAMLFVAASVVWTQTEAAGATAVITVTSSSDTTIPNDGACTLREAIANANSDSDTSGGDCAPGSGSDTIRFAPALAGSAITLGGSELVLSSAITVIGPGANLLTISGSDASRVISVTASGVVEMSGVTIANGRITNGSGGGIANAGSLILARSTIAHNTIASGGVTDGGGIHNSGTLTITHSAIVSNTNSGSTARGGGLGLTDGRAAVLHSTISGNSANSWGGGIHNTGYSTLLIDHSTVANNTAVFFWGGGLLVNNNTAVTIRNSILAENQDITGVRDCYYFGLAPVSQGYNVVENRGNCAFSAAGDSVGQNAQLGPLADNGGLAVDADGNPAAPGGQATFTHALLPASPAINRIPAGVGGCALTASSDQRSYFRNQACDSGAFEYDGIQLTLFATVNDDNPGPSDLITYTLVVAAARSGANAEGLVVTDVLPVGLNDVGLATAVAISGSLPATAPPTLLTGVVVTQGTAVTITLPVTVSIGLAGGTHITNTAFAASAETGMPAFNWQTITVKNVPPVATADFPTVLEDSPTTNFAVQANDYDLNGDIITTTAVGTPDQGGTAVITHNLIAYTPFENFNGTELFTYTLSDGELSHIAAVSVTVIPVNDAPVLAGSHLVTVTVDEDGTLPPFHFNASDVDGDPLGWTVADGVGTAVTNATPGSGSSSAVITYTLAADFVGVDSFEVQAGDGTLTDTLTVSVTVLPVGDAPRAAADVLMIAPIISGTAVTIDVLTNDVEVDGETLILDAVGLPDLGGTAHISGTAVVYTPTLALGETETFTYTVSDGVLTDTANVTVTAVPGLHSGQPGDTLIIPNLSDSSITLTLDIPPDAAVPGRQLSLVVVDAPMTPQHPADYRASGLNVLLNTYIDGALTTPYTPTTAVTLTLSYSNDAFTHLIRGERDLALFAWANGSWGNEGIRLVAANMETNQIVFTSAQLTQVALFGWNGIPVYLPVIVRP